MLAAVLVIPAFSPMRGVRPQLPAQVAPIGPAARAAVNVHMSDHAAVPLTGETLAAALKMRCDTTGAQYAIYWSQVNGAFKATGSHVANPATAGYVEDSQLYALDAGGGRPCGHCEEDW